VSRFSVSPRRVLLALLVSAAVVAANPTWAAAIGLDVWNLPALRQCMETEDAKRRAFAYEDAELFRRMDLKDRLVAELIAGRTTLADVTEEFVALNRDRPGYTTTIRATYPGQTDEERTARNVLGYVSQRMGDLPPARQAEVMARLESEFARFVATAATNLH
jgi:hypothetical protein